MDISILIPNHNDLRIKNLIESIDYYNDENKTVELVIVLNKPTNELKELIDEIVEEFKEKFKFNIVNIDYCNLGLAYNIGIENATFDNVLFLDSDIICDEGSIDLMVEEMKQTSVKLVKAKLLYENDNSFFGKIIYRTRTVTTTDAEPPYIPVILIKKDIFNELDDGYMFPIDTVWCADADFAYRVLEKKVKISYINAVFYHPSMSLKKDLKDAFLYGLGKGIRTKRTKEDWNPIKEIIFFIKLGNEGRLSLLESLYLFIWTTIMQIACFIQQFIPNNTFFEQSLDFENGKLEK